MSAEAPAPDPREAGEELPLLGHLIELRNRLLRIVAAVAALFLALIPFANSIYGFIAAPLMALLPAGNSMIATGVVSPFLTPFKLALVLAFYLAIPYILYQVWGFIAPALYRNERRLILPLTLSSAALFYLGMAFAYYAVFPLIFAFLTSTAPVGVEVMPDIRDYLDFALKLFFAFGVAFEAPVAVVLLVRMGAVSADALARKRPYIIVGAFVLGMLLTPPDVISQTLLAIPLWLLFEIGLLCARLVVPQKRETPEEAEAAAELERIETEEANERDAAP